MLLGRKLGLDPRDIVLDWDAAPPPQKGADFGPVYCAQTAGWIKMPLGTKVGLGPGRIVLHGDPAPLPKGAQPPIRGPCLLWPNGRPSQYC